jgi:hypothetical protein
MDSGQKNVELVQRQCDDALRNMLLVGFHFLSLSLSLTHTHTHTHTVQRTLHNRKKSDQINKHNSRL